MSKSYNEMRALSFIDTVQPGIKESQTFIYGTSDSERLSYYTLSTFEEKVGFIVLDTIEKYVHLYKFYVELLNYNVEFITIDIDKPKYVPNDIVDAIVFKGDVITYLRHIKEVETALKYHTEKVMIFLITTQRLESKPSCAFGREYYLSYLVSQVENYVKLMPKSDETDTILSAATQFTQIINQYGVVL